MKKIVCLLMAVTLVFSSFTIAHAVSENENDVLIAVDAVEAEEVQDETEAKSSKSTSVATASEYTYEMSYDGKSIVITGYTGSETKITIPSEIDGYAVSEIGGNAFEKMSLKEVVLPEGIQYIRWSAFSNCAQLQSVMLPASLKHIDGYAFYRCGLLDNIVLNRQVNYVGKSAFEGCSSLSSIVFQCDVASIEQRAFAFCTSLNKAVLPYLDDPMAEGDGEEFLNCKKLVEVQLPKNAEYISSSMFSGCTSLKNIELPKTVTTIGDTAFANTALQSITIPEKVENIGESAFIDCKGLQEVTILGPIKTLKSNTFKNCSGLKKLTLPPTVTKIEKNSISSPKILTIYGITGSYAETYAKANGCKFVSTGSSTKPARPTGLKSKSYDGAKIRIWWKADSKVDGYYVYRATSKSGPYKNIKLLKNVRAYTDKNLSVGKIYYYKLVPYVTVNGKKVKGTTSGMVYATARA